MKKYEFFERMFGDESNRIRQRIKNTLMAKYYNLWMNKFEWGGLDEENKEQQENYIMKTFWETGKIALRKIKQTDQIIPVRFVEKEYNLLDYPETIQLINKRNASKILIPESPQVVNKNVAIIYAQRNHKSIKSFVEYYVDEIVFCKMILRNNLNLQKMPFIVTTNNENENQLKDIYARIMNDESVIFASSGDANNINAIVTNAPYIADKLKSMIVSLENELLTFLGIDNNGSAEKSAQMTVDEVNANNDCINDYGTSIFDYIKQFIDRANIVLGKNITIKAKEKAVDTTKELDVAGHQQEEEEGEDKDV